MSQSQPFLAELAELLTEKYKENISGLTIVFPNRRAGTFFRNYLQELVTKPIWSPEIIGIETFIRGHSNLQVADKLTLIFELYQVYKKYIPNQEAFDHFYFWGEMLLKDFDEADRYLTNIKDLFSNLKATKEIENAFDYLTDDQKKVLASFWKHFDKESAHQKSFLTIWKALYPVYLEFQEQLKNKGLAYEGLIYKETATQCLNNKLTIASKKVIFAGFNALNKSEEVIISWYLKNHSSEIFWDSDNYYLQDEKQEAGIFLRRYLNNPLFQSEFQKISQDHISPQSQEINIIGTSSDISQAKFIGAKLKEIQNSDPNFKPEKAVIVLPDESMLFPVLHTLPEEISAINVTMGYPLKNTSFFSLFEYLIRFQLQSTRIENSSEVRYHYRNVLAILKHPYIYYFNEVLAKKNIFEIESQNKIFITPSEIHKDEHLYPALFQEVTHVSEVFEYLQNILIIIHQQIKENKSYDSTVELEYIFQFYTQLNRLKEIIHQQQIDLGLQVFMKLFRQIIKSLRLPFSGEPLSGLQVMGLLETRNLDFEYVFILSMNEGIFPSGPAQHSFIPYNLRRGFGLPTFEHNDAIQAYLFYRLLQRSKHVTLLYNTEESFGKNGERSRYLNQLMMENNWNVKHSIFSAPARLASARMISLEKTPAVMKNLERFIVKNGRADKRFTPSAINMYLDCSLKFYFRQVAGIYEKQEVKEEVDPMMFGIFLHDVLENLYRPFANNRRIISEQDIDELPKKLDKAIETAFKKHFAVNEDQAFHFTGRNVIIREILKKLGIQILDLDKQYAPFQVVGLETEGKEAYTMDLPVSQNGSIVEVGLRGIIDRIDKKDNLIRVIDYKSGKDDKSFESIESLFDRNNKKRNKAALQTIFYSLLYYQNSPFEDTRLVPGIYNARQLFDKSFDYRLKIKQIDQKREYVTIENIIPLLDEYRTHLQNILSEIFNKEIPFVQTSDVRKCANCGFVSICHK